MAKKITKEDKKKANYSKGVSDVNIGATCKEYMKIFGANTNLMRHLPSVYDGLKPGERRLLYGMYTNKLFPENPYRKSSVSVTSAMLLHPHGGTAIYDTMVKLAQPWSSIEPLVDGHGNFGDVSGEGAAAERYTESRLSKYAYKCFFEEFNDNIVDMKTSYLGDMMEPEFLPSKYPNVLINNTFGIGYGISTSIPTYNFKEVCELTIQLLEDPDYSDFVLIPDSPTGAYVVDEGQFQEITDTGKGKYRMRAVIDVNEDENSLTIRAVPFQVSLRDVMKDENNGAVKMLSELGCLKAISNDSEKTNMSYKIFLKKEIDPITIKHLLYTKTQLEKTFPVSFKVVEDYEDVDYNIKNLLLTWIDFRRETKRRIFNHKMLKSKERQHILEILLFILNKDNAEKTLAIIKKSENKKEIVSRLMKEYGITSLQADIIAEMKMSAFSKESYKKYVKEKEEIDETIKDLDKTIRSPKKIDKIIKKELEEGIKLFGKDRKSEVINIDNEVKIRDTNHIIVVTMNGFIKKLPDDIKNIGFVNQGDYPIEIIEINNTKELLIFDETGKISKIPVSKINSCPLNSEGEKISNYCTIGGKIVAIKTKPTEEDLEKIKEEIYFIMVTKDGIIKKTPASSYTNIKNELLGMIVRDDDKLVTVKLVVGDKDILLYTNKGFGNRFSSSEVRDTSRMSIGVKGIDLGKEEYVIGMDVMNDKDKYLFALTGRGNGKKCELSTFKTMTRNSKPLRIISLDDNDYVLTIRTVKGKETFKAYLKSSIEEINMDDVPTLPRLSKGKKLFGVKRGDVIIDIKENIK